MMLVLWYDMNKMKQSIELIKKLIWGYKQNNPELVVEDLAPFVDKDIVRASLMRRGVNKWLHNRKLFIRLKIKYKLLDKELLHQQRQAKTNKDWNKYYELKGMRKILLM